MHLCIFFPVTSYPIYFITEPPPWIYILLHPRFPYTSLRESNNLCSSSISFQIYYPHYPNLLPAQTTSFPIQLFPNLLPFISTTQFTWQEIHLTPQATHSLSTMLTVNLTTHLRAFGVKQLHYSKLMRCSAFNLMYSLHISAFTLFKVKTWMENVRVDICSVTRIIYSGATPIRHIKISFSFGR